VGKYHVQKDIFMRLGFILDSEYLPLDLEALLKASHDSYHLTYSDLLDGNKSVVQKLVSCVRDNCLIKELGVLAFYLVQRFESRKSGKISNDSLV